MTVPPPDRLRELLDAIVPGDEHDPYGTTGPSRLADLAAAAHSSPFHFARQVSSATGEAPMALRRRILLERAAWRLQRGATVTSTAFEAGYGSVEGFARAFAKSYGCPPSELPSARERGHWLPAPNGLHFHSPTVIYLDAGPQEHSVGDVTLFQVQHDLADTEALLRAAGAVPPEEYRRPRLPGHRVLRWTEPDESLADTLVHLVRDKVPWLASIEGADHPDPRPDSDPASLLAAHHGIAARWLAWVRDVERRGAWQDRIIDALCDPPESFLLSQVLVHVLTFAAHRRQLARWFLAGAGIDVAADPSLDPDPIIWHRNHTGGLL